MTLIKAVKDFFGLHPEYGGLPGLRGFALELKRLGDKDKAELASMLSEHFGEEIEV